MSTQAHLDPTIMTHTQQQGEIPHLGVASPAEIRAATLDSSSPLYASDTTSTGSSGLGHSHGTTERVVPSGLSYPDSSPNPYHGTGTTGTAGTTGSTTDSLSHQAESAKNNAASTAADVRDNAASTAANARDNAASTAANVRDNAANTAANVKDSAASTANTVADKAVNAKNNIAANVEPTVQGLRARANQLGSQATEVTHQVAEHPVVQNAKQSAEQQVGQFREFLGNFPVVKDLEKRTGVDRVALVAGGVVAYFLLVPMNLFGLALPVTQFLTFVPPTILALDILERRDTSMKDEDTKTVLAYFVVLGFIQFIESLAPGVLARRIPQYWTVKLIFLAYLIHPQTKGALKIHNSFLKNFVTQSPSSTSSSSFNKTPPTSNPFNGASQASSPNYSPRVGTADVTSQYPTQATPVVVVAPNGAAAPATLLS